MSDPNLNRRDLLKMIGTGAAAALAGPAALSAAAQEQPRARPTRAGRRLKLGIFSSVYGHLPLEEATKRIKADGFVAVVSDYTFKDVRFDPWSPDWEALKKITAAFEREGIAFAGLYGYYNVIDPDPARRKRGEARIDLIIKEWKRFGSPIVSTETGSYNPQSEFAEDPKNYTEEGYSECRKAFERLVKAAEKTGAIIAIEPYWRNVIDSVDRTERLFKDIDSPSLRLTMDPCNYFRPDDLPRMKAMLEDIFKRVGSKTVIAHAKDVRQTDKGQELPAAGLGALDYPTYLRSLAAVQKELFLVIEHLQIDDVARARDYVRAQMRTAFRGSRPA